ncbi:MAG TPA: dimethylargininase [Thermoanaerobaculia bacterium]
MPALLTAITRDVSPDLQDCELSHLPRRPIDVALAREQHRRYQQALARLGCRVTALPVLKGHPDSVFVEDTAVVLDEVAVITRPGAESRRGEVESVATALAAHRELRRITAPGTLDGGDVLRIGRTLYVGLSARSDPSGVTQLRELLEPFGYRVLGVPLTGCLHLKSAATLAAPDVLLINPAWVDGQRFHGAEPIPVDPAEPHAANSLGLPAGVLYPASCPRTAERLLRRGLRLEVVDMSETEKAEGGVTCCSLVFDA